MQLVYARVGDGLLGPDQIETSERAWYEIHTRHYCEGADIGVRSGLTEATRTVEPLPVLLSELIDAAPDDAGPLDIRICGCVRAARTGTPECAPAPR